MFVQRGKTPCVLPRSPSWAFPPLTWAAWLPPRGPFLFWALNPGAAGGRFVGRAAVQGQLHHHNVDPAAELEADATDGADMLKAGPGVHADRAMILGV